MDKNGSKAALVIKEKYPSLEIGTKAIAFYDRYLKDTKWQAEAELVYIQYHCIKPFEEGNKSKEDAARHLQWLYDTSIGKDQIPEIEHLLAA